MDYKKAYEEALKRAKKRFVANPTDGYVGYGNEILKEIFPELTESEDDRIRKEMLNSLKETEDCIVLTPFKKKSWIAYLERQKPMYNLEIPAGDIAPAEEDSPFDEYEFLEGELSAFLKNYDKEYDDDAAVSDVARHFYEIGKKQKEQKLSTPEDIAAAYQMGLTEGRKEQKPVPTEDEKDFLEKEAKAFLCNYDKEFDDDAPTYDIAEHFYQLGKNSQKPAEDKDAIEPTPEQDYSGLTDLERAIHRGFLCAGVENVPVVIIKDTAHDCLAHIKPAEWSEEDEKKIGRLRSIVNEYACRKGALDVNGDYCEGDYGELDDWLKSIPERFNLQSKQEWSEEDERAITEIVCVLSLAPMNAERSKELCNWIQHLRPSWKPSEEQMKALEDAFRKDGGNEYRKVINSLYRDLKKLL